MTDEPGFGKETHSTYEPLPEEIAARRVTDPPIQWERHEGMVTVYREDGTYAGCMGAERWERLLRADEVSRVTDPAAHTPSDPAGAPDVEALAQTVRKALIRSFDVRGSGVLHPNDIAILHALSDLAATAREKALAYGEEALAHNETLERVAELERELEQTNCNFVLANAAADVDEGRVAELEAALREIRDLRLDESRALNAAGHAARGRIREIARAALAGDRGGA